MKCSSLTNMRHLWQVNPGRAESKLNSAAVMEYEYLHEQISEVADKICNPKQHSSKDSRLTTKTSST